MPDHTDADAVNYTYRYPDLVAFSTADPDVLGYAATDAEHPPDAGADSYSFAIAHRDSANPNPDTQQHIYPDTEYDSPAEYDADAGDLRAG